jgi:hypothetical protein
VSGISAVHIYIYYIVLLFIAVLRLRNYVWYITLINAVLRKYYNKEQKHGTLNGEKKPPEMMSVAR